MKTIQEIYEQDSIRLIEEEILFGTRCIREELGYIRRLLERRKELLDKEFVMNEEYKRLLEEFNEAIKALITDMRTRIITAYQAIADTEVLKNATVSAKCFFSSAYPKGHPIQTDQAKEIWLWVLNNSVDDYMPVYQSGGGIAGFEWWYGGGEPMSENDMLYRGKLDSQNEYLNKELTDDMHLVYPFHFLYELTSFSIFDLLWVRRFDTEITINQTINSTYTGWLW